MGLNRRDKFRKGDGYGSGFAYRSTKSRCDVCGLSRDVFHDDAACSKRWLEMCDKEARDSGRARKP